MDLKKTWKKTGVQIGHAFRDLGKTVVQTVAAGVQKAGEWADEVVEEAGDERVETTEASDAPADDN